MSTATGTATTETAPIIIAKVGQPAPDFDMPSTKNIETLKENVKLADYKGKWLILMFYPLDFTFVCSTELTHFSDRLDEIQSLGADVVGVSTDSVFSHRAWLNTPRDKNGIQGVKYPIASDASGTFVAAVQHIDRRSTHLASRPAYHRPRGRPAVLGRSRDQYRAFGGRNASRATGSADRRSLCCGLETRDEILRQNLKTEGE
jgi:peroxiredoxin